MFMSKMGETTDTILEILNCSGSLSLKELEKKIPLADKAIIDFMRDAGFITMKNKEIEITEFGSEILNVNEFIKFSRS
jgi:predicted transcriptional regulator